MTARPTVTDDIAAQIDQLGEAAERYAEAARIRAWNDAIGEAAKMANARFLVDPLTSPAIHILGLMK